MILPSEPRYFTSNDVLELSLRVFENFPSGENGNKNESAYDKNDGKGSIDYLGFLFHNYSCVCVIVPTLVESQ